MNEIIEATPTAPQAITPIQPQAMQTGALIQLAVQQGAGIDMIERLVALHERHEANEARKAFNAAFAAFKAEGVRIVKNIDVKDGPLKGKRYADLFAVVDTLTPVLSRHGLSASWRLTKDDKDWMEVTCVLAHVGGHCETVSMGGPPDAGGAKNQIQARASCQSYLRRYTFLAITGMAAAEEDDDGAGGAQEQAADPVQAYRGPLAILLRELVFDMRGTTDDAAALDFFKANREQLKTDKQAYELFKSATAAHRSTFAQQGA